MGTQITLTYTAPTGIGQLPATIGVSLGSVPLPLRLLSSLGLRVVSDTTTNNQRVLILSFIPTGNASIAANMTPDTPGQGGGVVSVTVGDPGGGYAAPPVIQQGSGVIAGAPPVQRLAQLKAIMRQASPVVIQGGANYSATPTITFVGGLLGATPDQRRVTNANFLPNAQGPGGQDLHFVGPTEYQSTSDIAAAGGVQQAQGHAIVGGTAITAIVIDTPGHGYIQAPDVVITDPTGSGATAQALMGVDFGAVFDTGNGYSQVPALTAAPLFGTLVPNVGTQQANLVGTLIKGQLQKACSCPIFLSTAVA